MSRKLRIGCGMGVGGSFVLLLWASCIEPRWLEVTEHVVELPVKEPLTIAHLSDLHIRSIGALEDATLAAVRDHRPDVIVITGDLYDRGANKDVADEFVAKLAARLGVHYVPGNWEHWIDDNIGLSDATTLINRATRLRDDVWIAGFDDAFAGTPKIEDALGGIPADAVTIGLFHSPAFFDRVHERVELALAGHTHGGQVRLPFVGALWLPGESGAYEAGWYRRGEAHLFVTRGIGTSMLPIRFLCRPELAIIRVRPGRLGAGAQINSL